MQTLTNQMLSHIGRRLYHCERPREYVYYLRFRARCLIGLRHLERLDHFFSQTEERRQLISWVPEFVEQTTRHFFHRGTSWQDRVQLVQQHVEVLESLLNSAAIESIYKHRENLLLWEDTFKEQPLRLHLGFHSGEKKEGCLSLRLTFAETLLYRIIFWFAKNPQGEPVICVGAMQGMNAENASTVIHDLTKAFFGYRTKNLIFFCLRHLAAALGVDTIHAVTNAGHYTMDRIKSERTLKTDLDAFWAECGGTPVEGDDRFYALSSIEPRKSEAEIKPNKRSQYRHRFEKLDAVAEVIHANVAPLKRNAV